MLKAFLVSLVNSYLANGPKPTLLILCPCCISQGTTRMLAYAAKVPLLCCVNTFLMSLGMYRFKSLVFFGLAKQVMGVAAETLRGMERDRKQLFKLECMQSTFIIVIYCFMVVQVVLRFRGGKASHWHSSCKSPWLHDTAGFTPACFCYILALGFGLKRLPCAF